MANHAASIDKLSIPSPQGAVPRRRLFRSLGQNKKGQIHWISSPAGAGKTTLVASYIHDHQLPCLWYHMDEGDSDLASFFYFLRNGAEPFGTRNSDSLPLLTPEYSFGIQTFFIRFFEELSATLPHGACLVFDNYHHIPAASAFHNLIAQGLEIVSGALSVIIISRTEPPASFARLSAGGKLKLTGWPDLRLSSEETRAVVRKAVGRAVSDDTVAWLQAASEGWAAGIVLMMESLKREDAQVRIPEHLTLIQIFDYLAGEVFDKADHPTQQVLLISALLPVMPGALANTITGIPGADEILARFGRNHFFTEKLSAAGVAYRFHSLFRQFLIARAKAALPAERVLDVQSNAALLFRREGLVEDAAQLWRDCGDWEALSRLVLEEAPRLLSQGRAATLLAWIEIIPDELRRARPWLLYWQGVADILRDLQLARSRLELAYRSFRQQGDVAGTYLAWSGIIDTFTYEWSDFSPLDHWIDELQNIRNQYPEFPAPEIDARVTAGIFCALMYRQPQHADLPLWEDRLKHILLEGKADYHLRMIMSSHLLLYYMWWIGDLSKAAIVIKTLRQGSGKSGAASLPTIIWSGIEAGYYWMAADTERCVQSATTGLQEADRSGIHLWDFMLCAQGVYGTLSAGDGAQAAAFLGRMEVSINPGALQHTGHYHFLAAWEALYKGQAALAEEHARTAHRLVEQAGTPFTLAASKFGLGEVLIERGDIDQAMPFLTDALEIGRAIRSRTTEYQALLRIAYGLFKQKKIEAARTALNNAFAIGRAQGYFNFAWWRPQMITRLCCEALDAGIEREYVRELIILRRSNMALPAVAQADWPWELMIYTLGKFEVVIDGKPLSFEGRVQQMPLNLLKAIIALGGTAVPQEKLEQALWPDSEGDAAHTAFGTNLHRLRKLLGRDDFIQVQNGLVSLDAGQVWVDLSAFEQTTETASNGEDGITQADAKLAIELYRGHLFPGDLGKAWTITRRERAKVRFRRAISSLAAGLERIGNWTEAALHYERGLELDEVAEEFYLKLMNCHLRLGERAKALSVYERCHHTLAAILQVQPSPEIQRLALHIRSAN